MILTQSKEQGEFPKSSNPSNFLIYSYRPLKMDPIRAAVPLLWLSLCFGNILEAAVLGSLQYPSGADDNGLVSHLDERSRREPTAVSRKDPPINDTIVPHEYMVSLYRTLSEIESRGLNSSAPRTARLANTVTSFVDQGKDHSSWGSGQRYLFDLSSLSRTDELVEAELRILRKPPLDLLPVLTWGRNLYRLLLYTCSSEGNSGRRLLDSRTVDVLDGEPPKWDVFDVWASVKARRRSHRTAAGNDLLVACFDLLVVSELTKEAANPLTVGLQRQSRQPQERALLVAFSRTRRKENLFKEIREQIKAVRGDMGFLDPLDLSGDVVGHLSRRRRRRTALTSRSIGGAGGGGGGGVGVGGGGRSGGGSGRRKTRCSRRQLHVNFKELGWDDWIIAPLDYEAHHCEGVCDFPLRSHLEPTNHAIIQTLMNSMDPDSSPPSCCVPSKLSPISILYIDSGNNVVYKQYEDMVVESCGCR
ncbi:growth/differentiation factor 6-A-like [Oncorhynchus tshawytscha]|uniref:growth/differentiation factor 6-A-like n=1 Tax=Oncorhynchus tshawytscha TaxID=74940 RepID=UPI000D0A8D1C|nr:growth/differentiation factor 6-A-like [Oncorhynchus tshawytscha]